MKLNANSTVTIFGGTGFVGKSLICSLAKTGATIRLVTRVPSRAAKLRVSGNVGQIIPIYCNFADEKALAEVVEASLIGADAVINLVGNLHEPFFGRKSFGYKALLVKLPEMIAKSAAKLGVKKLVHLSSISADKTSKISYRKYKAEGEEALLATMAEAVIMRPSLIFGDGDGFFNNIARVARLSPFVPVFGGGHAAFQPVYVNDVVAAIMAVLADDATNGEIYELGGTARYTYRQLTELILKESRLKRRIISVPFWYAKLWAMVLPRNIATAGHIEMLKTDMVISGEMKGLEALGIHPTSLELILPDYMEAWRNGGQFNEGVPALR